MSSMYPSLSIGFEGVSPQMTPQGAQQPANPPPAPQMLPEPMRADENTSLVNDRNLPPAMAARSADEIRLDICMDEKKEPRNETPDADTLMFRDGERKIDYVLAYKDLEDESKNEKRVRFLTALREEGLELEIEDKKFSQDGLTYFCKLYVPWNVCLNHAELLKMKMPIQANDIDEPLSAQCFKPCGPCRPNIEDEEDFFTSPFFKDGNFIGYEGPYKEKLEFFSSAQRGRMVYEILLRTRYGNEREHFGIKRLMKQAVFAAAYPLHEGAYESKNQGVNKIENKRQELYYEWARPGAFMKEQPYDAIRAYFGEKVAIYFSWLGFYTLMLVPASIVGLIVFIYGLATMSMDVSSNEICDSSDVIMCPLCDVRCGYWTLNSSCLYSKITYVVDNPATIFFTIFMALWTTFFTEFWKRQQARIQYDWDVADYEEVEQNIRPEFQAAVTHKRKNPITQDYEPHMRGMERCIRVGASLSFVLFLICVVVAAILGVIVYRIIIVVLIYKGDNELLRKQARLITSVTAACLSVLAITILNKLYEKVAIFLTNMETWKYQSEWEDAFTFKMYIFQFFNYYGTIIYIAFLKGRLIGYPGDYDRTFAGYRGEECDPAGCLIELAIQLAIVMFGKQALNNIKEIVIPLIVKCIKTRRSRKKKETEEDKYTSWERDFDLVDFPIHGLYEEYLEMVIQYGFVTLFVAAFPLAPFLALLNNIIEVRLDAMKLVTQLKRPMAERAQDIGTWFYILQAISKMAILSNACIIAFTSDFIQKSIYQYVEQGPTMNETYIQWSLSSFRTEDFQPESKPDESYEREAFGNLNMRHHFCRYRDFRGGYEDSYHLTSTYWHVLTARLAFIIVFEHLVLGVTALIDFLVPDIPADIKDRSLREKHLAKVSLHERIKTEEVSRSKNYKGSTGSVNNATAL